MFTFSKHKVHLVIKDHVFRFVETTQPSLQHIKSYGERYLPPGIIREGKIVERETLTMILSEMVENYNLQRKATQFIVPDAFVVVRKIKIPSDIPEDEITGHIYLEIGETIHLPFDDAQFDFSITNKTDDFTEIVLVASPRTMIEDYKSIIEDCKLKPVAADLSSLSIHRLLEKIEMIFREEHVMLVQFDINSVNVTIFHDEIPQFTRHLKLNLDHELWEVTKGPDRKEILSWKGEISELEGHVDEMVSEIERMMSFYRFSVNQGQAGVSKLLVTGDYPRMEPIIERLRRLVEVPVELIQESLVTNSADESIPTRYHELIGLSLKREVRR
ncbi:type IV pilus biogenesis protein PilM [Calidifontibacillus oryziterrae]|uniref:type IV pilus biogenesis protein PilM n=1 Tax=Calidifontibacillus oryziterrae TaxID=1191699 RepID=UPI0002E9CC37|nr:pilus assembly protein PilM [Calidifontibacillus oryziterrae]